jgi:hypothetical protein
VVDLQASIVSRSLEDAVEDIVVDDTPVAVLADLGVSFCGIPPEEMNVPDLLPQDED